ncbi:hypothetical protein WJX75_003115 [Coccomyxa subellipsoidea]|uniref:Uncharacterized protein n=1 Tax=Coccomyxa subellipsoidea TaxID=248742 RepID=A0ABR2YZF2_9CHLO
MSILRQQASRSTAFANRKREVIGEAPPGLHCESSSCADDPIGSPTVQNLQSQFDAEEERKARHFGTLQPVAPSPLSPLSMSSTPIGPSRTTSGMSMTMSHMNAESQLPLGPSTLRAVTPLSPLGLPPTGSAQHFTRYNPLAEATPAGPSHSLGTSPAALALSRPSFEQARHQEDSGDESSSSMAAVEEPYLRNNPAFEAYLDSDTSSTDSIESDSCTTPRSAIQEQVAGSPWLARVQTFIQSPQSASAGRTVAKSAPPTVQRGVTPDLHSKDGAVQGQMISSNLRGSVSRALFAPAAEPGTSADTTVLFCTAQRPLQPAHGRHTAPASPCREWALGDTPQAAQVREAAAVVDRLHEGVARAAAACSNAALDGAASPASQEVLRAAAVVDRLQAGVQRQAAALRCAEAARLAAAAGPGAAGAAARDPAAWPDESRAGDAAHSRREEESDAKLGKRGASLCILASGCSETAELLVSPPTAGTSHAGWALPAEPVDRPLPNPTPTNIRRSSRSSWLRSALLFCTLAALLGCAGLLLAGHHMAGSQDRLASLRSGSYGAAAALFGRCMSHLQPPPDAQQHQNKAGLGHSVAVETACMYSAIRREATFTWGDTQSSLSSRVSTARTAAEQAAAILGARLTPILDSAKVHAARGVAACQPFGAQIAGIISEKCPVCVSTAEAVARRAGGLAEAGGGMLARWHAASGTGELTAPPSSELYHGATLLRGLPQQLGAVKASLTKQISQMVGGAAPAWATETASRLRTRVIGAWTVWTGLLEQSAAAVQPEPMRAAAKQPPRGEAGHLAEAARRAGAWFGSFIGSKTAPPAEQPPAEKAEDIPDALAAPAQTHVLRWPGTQTIEPAESAEAEAPTHADSSKMSDGQAQEVAGQSWARPAGVLAAASMGAAMLAALAVYCMKAVAANSQLSPPAAGAKQVQAPRVSSEAVGNECHPAVMDLSAHAPSPILVPSAEQEVPLKAAHHTPRGRPSKKGAASTPMSRSASRRSAQRTPVYSAPATGSASEPRVTRSRTRFAEELRRTPRATVYPGPWQE